MFLGDFGFAIRDKTGTHSDFTFRDTGTSDRVGESSRKLCRTLVPTPDDNALYNEDFASFLVFPGSRTRASSVEGEIKKLNQADNAMELLLFLGLGADLGRYKAALANIYAGRIDKRSYPIGQIVPFMKAFRAKGAKTWDWELPARSVNL